MTMRHNITSHLILPTSSIPPEIASTRRLEQNGKNDSVRRVISNVGAKEPGVLVYTSTYSQNSVTAEVMLVWLTKSLVRFCVEKQKSEIQQEFFQCFQFRLEEDHEK